MAVSSSRRLLLAVRALLPALVLVSALTACDAEDEPKPASPSASATPLPPDGFYTAVGVNDAVVIDVRPRAAYAAGHLDRSINIDPRSASLADEVAELDSKRPYAVYGDRGDRPAEMVRYLLDHGFERLYLLDGGIAAWIAAGRDVVR